MATQRIVRSKKKRGAHRTIAIISCSGGAGHLRAADALYQSVPHSNLPITAVHRDILDLTTPLFKRLYSGSYLQLVNKTPDLWSFLYNTSERTPYKRKGAMKIFDRINYHRYLRFLQDLRPDAIVCTHFLPYLSVSTELRPGGVTAPVISVTTDFDVHQLWINPIVDRYTVFHEETSWSLQTKGIPSDHIWVRGIPVHPEFRTKISSQTARRRLKLPLRSFTILVLAGGFGVGRIDQIVETILRSLVVETENQFTVVAVCGRNDAARSSVAKLTLPAHVHLRTLGFVDNIHELMDASDLLVSKSGGLTSSESLAKGLPMLIIDPIPGQESRNADMIIEHGAGWKAATLAGLSYKLHDVIRHPSQLHRAAKKAASLGRPDAAMDILHDVYRLIEQRKASS